MRPRVLGALTVLVVLSSGCARQVVLRSEPVRARVYIERQFAGYTPLTVHLSSSHRNLRFESPGYTSITGILRREYDPRSFSAIAIPPLLLVPHLVTRLKPEYTVRLQEGGGEQDVGIIE